MLILSIRIYTIIEIAMYILYTYIEQYVLYLCRNIFVNDKRKGVARVSSSSQTIAKCQLFRCCFFISMQNVVALYNFFLRKDTQTH